MNDNETIDRLVRIIEKLVDENAELRRKQVYIPYPSIPTQRPTTWPSPTITCDTEVDA